MTRPEASGWSRDCPNPGCGWVTWGRDQTTVNRAADRHAHTCKHQENQ